jgi:hypothetical protein
MLGNDQVQCIIINNSSNKLNDLRNNSISK